MAGRKGEKHWRDAVMLAVNETVAGDETGRKKLRAIADKVVELAMGGDMAAIREIGDRMDGKAPQAITHANDPDNPLTRADELTDEELAGIAAGGGAGIVAPPSGADKPH